MPGAQAADRLLDGVDSDPIAPLQREYTGEILGYQSRLEYD
jgi:hypothetical protein